MAICRLLGRATTDINDEIAAYMGGMPMDVQRIFADKLDTGMNVFKEELSNMLVANEGNVIKRDEVEKMMETVRKRTGMPPKAP